ncbi:MAG TPA: alkaline phosphatase family protein, partial [Rhodothermales bacterium]|nr:alkaline phosphatase family protein [Rhodothermales bacterium]
VVVASDHGMTAMSANRVVFLDDHVDLGGVVERAFWGEPTGLWPRPGRERALYAALRDAHVPHVRVVRREETDPALHYRASPRIPPVLLMADEGWTVTTRAAWARRDSRAVWGNHGYDPRLASMGGLLIASGPSFRQGVVAGPVENVHVYPLLTHLLGLQAAPNDGDLNTVRDFLR